MTNYRHGGRLFIIALLFAFFSQTTFAAGERDPNFGTGGSVVINFGGAINALTDAALQADGKLVVVGGAGPSAGQTSFALARLNTDGTLDSTFGTGGKVVTNLDNLDTTEQAQSVLIQPDGKIVVGGNAVILVGGSTQNYVFALVRYNPNGSLDSSFGSGGKVYTDLEGSNSERISKVLLQSDGKILALGESYANNDNSSRIALVRYKANGQEDNDFRTISRLFIAYPLQTRFDDAVLQQPDNKILISGWISFAYTNCENTPTTFCYGIQPFLTRYSSALILDRKFGRRAGREFGAVWDEFTSVSILPDGRIATAGSRVRRYTPNGRLETNFAMVQESTEDVAQRPDGKFAGCGSSGIGAANRDVITSLYNENGTLIGTDSINIFTQTVSQEFCSEVLSQTDGKFIVAGTVTRSSGTVSDFFVVRYVNITP
ncbi:MAG TPA: hypothetical protein VGC76_03250 [Pyrinomonadaceae bacterium]